MSEQETLRMAAEVVDRWSGPLKKLRQSLRDVSQQSRDMNERGAKDVDRHAKSYKQLRENVHGFKIGLDAAFPAMGEFALGAFGVAGAVAAVGAAAAKTTDSWANWGRMLTWTARQSGMSANEINGLIDANRRLGISAGQTNQSLDQFGAHMNELARRSPIYLNAWKKYPQVWSELGRELTFGGLTRQQQLAAAMRYVPTLRDADARRKVLALLGLPEQWSNLTSKEMAALQGQAAQFSKAHPFNAAEAEKAAKAFNEIRSEIRGIENDLSNWTGSKLFDAMEWIANHADDFTKVKRALEGWWSSPAPAAAKTAIQGTFDKFGKESANQRVGDAFAALDKKGTRDSVAEGTRKGMLDALREWQAGKVAGQGGFAPGLKPMAYHPVETAPAMPRFRDAGGYHVDSVTIDKLRRSMGDTALAPPAGGSTASPTSGALAEQRQRFARELQSNPALRDRFMRIMYNEQGANALGTEGIAESAMNRAIVRGTSLAAQLRWHGLERGGYYAPGNMGRGALENPRIRAILEHSLAAALAGSNVVRGATDNSSGDLAARERESGRFRFLRGIHGESFFAPGWGEPALARTWDRWHGMTEEAARHGARMRDLISRGRPSQEPLPGRQSDAGSLHNTLGVTIDINGLPRGSRFAQRTNGPIFKQITLNRGRPMATGSETS